LIASGVDVVLLALPTFFHPQYLKACVDAGKHVFCEKIHAVDAPGVRLVLEAGEAARAQGLSIVSGLAWRYDTGAVETMKRVHDGAIGQIVSIEETCNTGSLRSRPRQPGWTEMQYQIQDWYNFFWLSCDLPGLNAVHNLDKAAWAMHDQPPLRCWGMGGRQTRVGPQYGDAWDHHTTVFEYSDGTRLHSYCRQQDGCVDRHLRPFLRDSGLVRPVAVSDPRSDDVAVRGPGEQPFRPGARGLVLGHPQRRADQQLAVHGPQQPVGDHVDLGQLHRPGDHLGPGDGFGPRGRARVARFRSRTTDGSRRPGQLSPAGAGSDQVPLRRSIEKLKTIVGELEDELHRLPEIDQQANELLQEAVQEIQAVLHVRQHGGSPSDEGEPETDTRRSGTRRRSRFVDRPAEAGGTSVRGIAP
jgi:hypothetical protein